jgi:predicted MPP superfamily phosphohydrolase
MDAMGRRAAFAAVTAALGLGTLGYAVSEAHAYRLRSETIPVLPPGRRPLTVLHLSDLHLTPRQAGRIAWVRSLGDLDVDLVVSTGDHLAHPDAVPVALHALEPLLDRPGVFVLGSNDYFAPRVKNPLSYVRNGPSPHKHGPDLPWPELVAGLTSAGWVDVDNRRAEVAAGDAVVDVVGVDDPHLGLDRYPEVVGDATAPADLRLGVAHAPYLRVLDAMVADGCDVVVAGHTHGGQVCLPGFGALVTNCDLDRGRAKGLSTHPLGADATLPGASWLNVSAGIGTNPFTPIRLACRPEAVLLHLVPRRGADAGDG